jgi:hypothetical protein
MHVATDCTDKINAPADIAESADVILIQREIIHSGR